MKLLYNLNIKNIKYNIWKNIFSINLKKLWKTGQVRRDLWMINNLYAVRRDLWMINNLYAVVYNFLDNFSK